MAWITFGFGWSMGVFTTLFAMFGLSVLLARSHRRKMQKRPRVVVVPQKPKGDFN